MKINYNRNTKLVGLGMMPFYRIGPEKWFDNYSIISLYDWDVDSGNVFSLRARNPAIELKPENTSTMIKTIEFEEIIRDNNLEDSYFISYRPVEIPFGKVVDEGSQKYTTTFENKSWIRKNNPELPFPIHQIITLSEAFELNEHQYNQIGHEIGSTELVVQHEQLSGGRGTSFVSSFVQFKETLKKLKAKDSVQDYNDIIISQAIPAASELSFQACVTRHGVFIGPPQQQIVRDPLLVNVDSPTADQFCGGMISSSLVNTAVRNRATELVSGVGKLLQQDGYKGIFGVDFVINQDTNDVYLLEVNARMTGMLPLLTQLQNEVPFFLLHILEKIDADYSIDESVDLAAPESITDGTFLLLHDLRGTDWISQGGMNSGQYQIKDGIGKIVSTDIWLRNEQYCIHNYAAAGAHIRADARIGAIFTNSADTNHKRGAIPDELINQFRQSLNG